MIGSFRAAKPAKSAKEEHGLRGEYFGSAGKKNRALAFARTDPVIRIDFNAAGPEMDKLKGEQISATWQGSVLAIDTGEYEFIVRTEHSTRLWVNDMKKPLIDRGVKSGSDTEFRGSIYLLAGRAYPVRLEFSRGSLGVKKEAKEKPKPPPTSIALEWKAPRRAAELIPERNLIPADSATAFALAIPMPPDDRSAGYERGNGVSKAWVQATIDGAIDTAGYVADNLAELSGVKNDAADRKKKLAEFCVKFAERAFRRPLSPEQKKLYVDRQFEIAPDADVAVKRVVLLVLQSPGFLYREASGKADAFDVAARLSFGLWDSLPDDELIKAAAAGRLKTRADVTREAERMLQDRRAKAKIRGFFLRWLQVDQVAELNKDAKLFPGFDAHVAADLQTSLDLFLEETIWSTRSDYRQLLLAEHLYLNGRLAKIYGGDLPADAPFQKITLKAGERAGVLTHPLLLAKYSYVATSSPIHRGVFLARNVLGVSLRPPPDAFTPLPPELHPDLSTRERISKQTSPKDCRSCHGIINPLGFTLEGFDAIGKSRDQEKGKPIDATGLFVIRSGETAKFNGPRELGKFLAGSEEAQEAFVARLFHYLVRQPVLAYGPDKLNELRRFFADNDCNMRRLVVEIIAETALAERKTVNHESTK